MANLSGIPKYRYSNVESQARYKIEHVSSNVEVEDPVNKELLIYNASDEYWHNGNLEDMGEYSTGTEVMTFSSACWATPSYNISTKWYRNGNQITLLVPETIKATTPGLTTGHIFVTALPGFLTPQKMAPTFVIKTVNQSFDTDGCVIVGGGLRIYNGQTGQPFSCLSGVACGFRAFCVTYIVASALVLPSEPADLATDPVIVTAAPYTTAASLIRVNGAKTGVEEVDVQCTVPAANQFTLASGSTDLKVTADCDINQNVSTTSAVTFGSVTMTQQVSKFDTAITLASDSDSYVATQHAVKTYVDGKIGGTVAASTDNILARYDGTNSIQGSPLTVTDAGGITGLTSIDLISISTDNRLPRYNGNYGIQGSGITVTDTDDLSDVNEMQSNTIVTDVISPGTPANGVTVAGVVMKNALSLVAQAANPIASADTDIWSYTGNILRAKANNVMQIPTTAVTDKTIPRFNGTSSHLLQSSGVVISDANAITGAASITLTNSVNEFSTDGTLAGNSDTALPTEKAVKTYVDGAWSTHNVTWTGAISNTASTLSYRIANGCALLDIPAFTGTGASSAGTIHNTGTELPSAIRPATDHSETMYCQDNGTHMTGYVLVRTTGVISIYRMQVSGANVSYANFSSNGGNNGLIHSHTLTYKLA